MKRNLFSFLSNAGKTADDVLFFEMFYGQVSQMTFQPKRVGDIVKNHFQEEGRGRSRVRGNSLTLGTRVLMSLFGVCTLGQVKLFKV